jgi:hypothetical protein
MTEVDYSAEGYERYMRTRARVANWAIDSSANARNYSHPFDSHQPVQPPSAFGPVPEVCPDDSISLYDGGARRREREQREARSRSHPRSSEQRPQHLRSNTHHTQYTSRSSPAPQPMYYMQQGNQIIPVKAQPGSSGRVIDLSQYPSHSQKHAREIVLPQSRHGESYMIIPPKNRRVEVLSPTGNSQNRYLSSSHRDNHHSRSSSRAHSPASGSSNSHSRHGGQGHASYVQLPTGHGYVYGTPIYPQVSAPAHAVSSKKKESTPLLKRLLTGVTSSSRDKAPKTGRRRSY